MKLRGHVPTGPRRTRSSDLDSNRPRSPTTLHRRGGRGANNAVLHDAGCKRGLNSRNNAESRTALDESPPPSTHSKGGEVRSRRQAVRDRWRRGGLDVRLDDILDAVAGQAAVVVATGESTRQKNGLYGLRALPHRDHDSPGSQPSSATGLASRRPLPSEVHAVLQSFGSDDHAATRLRRSVLRLPLSLRLSTPSRIAPLVIQVLQVGRPGDSFAVQAGVGRTGVTSCRGQWPGIESAYFRIRRSGTRRHDERHF